MEGTPFGRYRLVDLLGRGGMGEVWRAFDTVTERTVAIKVLPTHLADDNLFQQRFRREARAAAGLDEPHVVPIFDFGEIDGRLYVAMRLIQGRDLQDLLGDGPFQPAYAVEIIEQIATALHAAHQIGLVHRDVKPSNILVTGDDFAYLIDFGIARAAGETSLTSSSITVGTWAYMAPERFKGVADARSDIYALACVLYQSLTSKHPFPGESLEQLATAHMFEPPPLPSMVQQGVPQAMDDVITTGMAKDPDQRYQTAKDLAQAARAALTTRKQPQADASMADTQAAPTKSAPGSPQTHSAYTKSRMPRLIAVAVAVGAVIVTSGVFIWRPWERQAASVPREPTGSPTSLAQAPPLVTTTTAVAPPPQPTLSPKAIDQLLLSPAELTKLLGTNVTKDPSEGGPGGPGLNSSSYGMADHSDHVTPPACVGAVFTGEHDVYADADPAAIKTQTFGSPNGINPGTPHLVQQTAAVFASPEGAQQLLTTAAGKWKGCAGVRVYASFGYESGAGFVLGRVVSQNEMITLGMASTTNVGPTNGADACQQALGVRGNVVVEVRTCEAPTLTTPPDAPSLAWVVPDAERVAEAMLQNFKP
ncbi:serine/threonine-protein kinase PknH/PknJ [Mycobacterium sp. ACS4054]|uniref:serine/threonine-protein kinase PknH/PknJ n=1 Tax=Mycobacterium sp. ACS4054 TaxID=1834119 RepID=UPI0009ECCFA5|nr:serine/threonine-protein kinase PknH/PknJ [Mycobacterium sp. ACS4054]